MSAPGPPPVSLVRTAASGLAWLTLLNGFAGIGVWVATGFLNRSMHDAPVQMGDWRATLSVLAMTNLAIEGGLPAAIQSRMVSPAVLAVLTWLQLAFGVLGGIALYGAAPLLALVGDDPDSLAAALRHAAWIVPVVALGLPPKAVMQRELHFKHVAMIESSSTVVFVAGMLALGPSLGVRGLIAATLARHACETLLYWMASPLRTAVFVRIGRSDLRAAREPLAFGGHMVSQSLVGTVVRQGDTYLVTALAGTVAGGIYAQAQQFVALPFSKLLSFVIRTVFPTFARVRHDLPRLRRGLAMLLRGISMLAFPMLLGLVAVSPRLLALYLGPQYLPHLDDAVLTLQVLCLGAVVFQYAYASGVVLNATGHARAMFWRQLAGGVVIAGLMVAGSAFGLAGITLGRAAGGVVLGVLFLHLASKTLGFSGRDIVTSAWQATIASSAMAAGVMALGAVASRVFPTSAVTGGGLARDIGAVLAAQVVAGVLIFCATLLAVGVRPRAELARLRGKPA